jgi:hypothetical protein
MVFIFEERQEQELRPANRAVHICTRLAGWLALPAGCWRPALLLCWLPAACCLQPCPAAAALPATSPRYV